ncbi:MAG: arginase family protein, partial [Actinomycetes bacterium]
MDEPRVVHDGVVGPVDAVKVPRFAGFATFARLPRLEDVDRFDCAVVGVPFDSGVTYRPGARFGPSYVRQGSRLLRPYNPAQDVEPFRGRQVVDAGDIAVNPFDLEEAIAQIQVGIGALASADGRLLTIGGDHTIALPILRVMHALHGPVALVHFDAHLDTWDTYFGAPFTHGTPFRRAWEEQLLLSDHAMHVGIRGPLYSPQDHTDDESFGFSIVHCHDL